MTSNLDVPTYADLRLEVDGAVARLTMARPEKANALSRRQLEDLRAAAAWIDGSPTIKVVLLDGEGRHFCGGADLTDDHVGASALSRSASIDQGRVVTAAVAAMRPVTIARLHGQVRGGGAVLAMACDLRFAIADIELSFPEARLGWPLPWGCIPRLVREVGPMRTADLVLNCRPMSAEALLAAGLVLFAGDAVQVDAMIEDTIANLAATASIVLESVKTYVGECADALVPAALGRSDVLRMRAAIADPEANGATKTGVPEMLAGQPIGARRF
jgi:enoyl-CoA hydratase/carnithine racemase